jgi:hypothetical protein
MKVRQKYEKLEAKFRSEDKNRVQHDSIVEETKSKFERCQTQLEQQFKLRQVAVENVRAKDEELTSTKKELSATAELLERAKKTIRTLDGYERRLKRGIEVEVERDGEVMHLLLEGKDQKMYDPFTIH